MSGLKNGIDKGSNGRSFNKDYQHTQNQQKEDYRSPQNVNWFFNMLSHIRIGANNSLTLEARLFPPPNAISVFFLLLPNTSQIY